MQTKKKMSRRTERELAFQVLYGLTFSPAPTEQALVKAFVKAPDQKEMPLPHYEQAAAAPVKSRKKNTPPPPPPPLEAPQGFAWELVKGVWEQRDELDVLLTRFSQNWRVERMGKVEITLLRLALYEILFRSDVPPKVAINEAIELSKQFGDDSSRGFVNGILDAAAKAAEAGTLHKPGEA